MPIDFRSLPRGSIALTYDMPRGIGWLKRLAFRQTYWGIRRMQHNVWPHGYNQAVHVQFKPTADGPWFSMTAPRGCWVDVPAVPEERCRVFMWDYAQYFSEQQWYVAKAYCERLIGIPYDYWQLVAIAIHEAFRWTPELDALKNRTVCSCAVMGALYKAWQLFPENMIGYPWNRPAYSGRAIPKPTTRWHNLTCVAIEHCPPSLFENEKGYTKIAEQGFGT